MNDMIREWQHTPLNNVTMNKLNTFFFTGEWLSWQTRRGEGRITMLSTQLMTSGNQKY